MTNTPLYAILNTENKKGIDIMINAKVLIKEVEERNAKVERTFEFCDGYLTDWLIRSAKEDLTIKVDFNIILECDDFYFINCDMSHAGNLYFYKHEFLPSSWTIFKKYVTEHGFTVELSPDYCPCCNGYPFKNAFKVTVKAP